MRKFDIDRSHFGLFEVKNTTTDMETAMAVYDRFSHFSSQPSQIWDAGRPRGGRELVQGKRGVYRAAGKRLLDVALVLISLPFSLMIIGLCALALWFEGGSPFYTQKRLGRDGKSFSIFKLRTMVRDADEVLETYLASDPAMRREWNDLQKLRNDPRVTRVGHFLRTSSLDELPQLMNVLKGDMSLIGPRPMMPDQLEMYGDPSAYNALRPGITGLWQVSSRNNSHFNYRQEVDAAYERSLSFGVDLTILVKTVDVVMRRTGV